MVASLPMPGVFTVLTLFAPSVAFASATALAYWSCARFWPLPRTVSEPKRRYETESQRYWDPFVPLLSRPFQEQPARADRSVDLTSVPDLSFALGTRSETVFPGTDLQASGSLAYTAFATVGDAEALGFAEEVLELFLPLEPESDEQPATTSITGTAAQARRRVSRGADRCMVPSLMCRTGRTVRAATVRRGRRRTDYSPIWSASLWAMACVLSCRLLVSGECPPRRASRCTPR